MSSRQVGVAGDRSDQSDLAWSAPRALTALSRVAGLRSPSEPAATRDHAPIRRAARSCSVRVIVFTPSHPSVESARKEEGESPRVHLDHGTAPAGGVTPAEQYAGPAVKTSNPSVAPRGAERAVGGIRAWGENPAAGPAHLRLYSHSHRLRARISKVARTSHAHRQAPASRRPADRPWPRGTMGLPDETTESECDIRSRQTQAPVGSPWRELRVPPASANATARPTRRFRDRAGAARMRPSVTRQISTIAIEEREPRSPSRNRH